MPKDIKLSEIEMTKIAIALNTEKRLRLFKYFEQKGQEGATFPTMEQENDYLGSYANFHLNPLLRAGLVRPRTDPRKIGERPITHYHISDIGLHVFGLI